MKKLFHILFLLCSLQSLAQNPNPNTVQKNKKQPANQPASKSISKNYTQNLVNSPLDHDNCVKKEFSIVFYVVLTPTGSVGAATPSNISNMVDTLNAKFKRICISFKNCSTVYIPNFNYSRWRFNFTESSVTNQYYTDKTINFYIVDSIYLNIPNENTGYAYGPSPTASVDKKEVIVIEKWSVIGGGSVIPIHQMGHFFGLKHTHDEINPVPPAVPGPPPGVISHEWANGNNCALHGDGLCDTEADPGTAVTPYPVQDGNGDFYIKPFDNYMSFYSGPCRFTQQQYNKMAEVALTTRFYLH